MITQVIDYFKMIEHKFKLNKKQYFSILPENSNSGLGTIILAIQTQIGASNT